MNQIFLRKIHKTIGIVLAFFIIMQAGSGLFLSFSVSHSHAHTDAVTLPDKQDMVEPDPLVSGKAKESGKDHTVVKTTEPAIHDHGVETDDDHGMLQLIHHGGGFIGSIYRILLASGFLFMAFSGCLIFYLTRKVMKS